MAAPKPVLYYKLDTPKADVLGCRVSLPTLPPPHSAGAYDAAFRDTCHRMGFELAQRLLTNPGKSFVVGARAEEVDVDPLRSVSHHYNYIDVIPVERV